MSRPTSPFSTSISTAGDHFPVAEVLRARGVKLLFASGYGSPGLEAPFLDAVIIKKPFEASDLSAAIARVAG